MSPEKMTDEVVERDLATAAPASAERLRAHIAALRRPAVRREWHGCVDPRGHSFSDGVCTVEGCGVTLCRE